MLHFLIGLCCLNYLDEHGVIGGLGILLLLLLVLILEIAIFIGIPALCIATLLNPDFRDDVGMWPFLALVTILPLAWAINKEIIGD